MHDNAVTALYHLDMAEEDLTSTELAKRVFDPGDTDEVRNADRKVRHYLTNHDHLVEESERDGGTSVYTTDDDLVHFGVGSVQVVTGMHDEVTVGLGRVMVYMDAEEKPRVVKVDLASRDGGDEAGSEE